MNTSADLHQQYTIRPMLPEDVPVIEDIAAAAWTPIYENFNRLQVEALGVVARPSRVERKRGEVREFALKHPSWVLVTECDGQVVGFITFIFDRDNKVGVIGNNAVHPDCAGRGIGTAQYKRVLQVFREQGMLFAAVHTGLDEAHAPARRAYERVGFVQVFSSVEYMMRL